MPLIHVQMLTGRTAAQKADFIREVAIAAQRTLQVPEHAVTIIINEVDHAHWGVGQSTMEAIRSAKNSA